jgi:protein-S-isoprenylcysteine O-methyltransferase Ste14
MRRPVAALITSLWFLAAPGLGGVLVPYLLTGWRVGQVPWPVRLAGVALVLLSAVLLALCFARFVTEGSGTPLPSAPTETVLVGGPYRYVRNPMYLAGLGVVLGQALLLGRPVLVLYAGCLALGFAALVHGYEEPLLRRRYGDAYDAYRRAVPAWWPNHRPWTRKDR